ncbi:EnvZ/OmpR regulon moderator MzrA [Shimwellia pseudoproteus]|nr:EnvZ/OmpR regulon moderator MzrA [Shimwellia pseudoproteus]MBJ3815350.1 EnvZ/OmpR regulon moderator MzrA [Shimwellia pseudoproteus]
MSNRFLVRQLTWLFLCLATAVAMWSVMHHKEATLEIRSTQSGVTTPDGFFVWHHLNAHGIAFKSITPHKNALLIKFDSPQQSSAAKAVLLRSLPQGYVIAQDDNDNFTDRLISRLKPETHHLG